MTIQTEPSLVLSKQLHEQKRRWLLTGRPFEKDRDELVTASDEKALREVEEKWGGWDKIKNALGFQDNEIEQLVQSQEPVLEIGPGRGRSSNQLQRKGINYYALEPSLALQPEEDDRGLKERLKSCFVNRVFGVGFPQ